MLVILILGLFFIALVYITIIENRSGSIKVEKNDITESGSESTEVEKNAITERGSGSTEVEEIAITEKGSAEIVKKRNDKIFEWVGYFGCLTPIALTLLAFLAGIISDNAYVFIVAGLCGLVIWPMLAILGAIRIFGGSRRRMGPGTPDVTSEV